MHLAFLLLLLPIVQSSPLPPHALLTITPRTLLDHYTRPPRIPTTQVISKNHLFVTLHTSQLASSSNVIARASLTRPTRTLHLHVTPQCNGQECSPSVHARLRLLAPVDSASRISMDVGTRQIRLSIPLLLPALRTLVRECAGDRYCLRRLVTSRCGGRQVRKQEIANGSCDDECVFKIMRQCAGEEFGVKQSLKTAGHLLLSVVCSGMIVVFLCGATLAFLSLPVRIVKSVGVIWQYLTKQESMRRTVVLNNDEHIQ